MSHGYRRALKYSRAWARACDASEPREVLLEGRSGPIRADHYLPRNRGAPFRGDAPVPVWVVLHGITVPGRAHPTLRRFCRALAETPSVVVCPEIPEWMRLDLAPEQALPVIQDTVLALDQLHGTEPARAGLIGFSFGAPQALAATADPRVAARLRCVAGFGGFCDLERTLGFLFTGRHEWRGRDLYRRPDPYGRWIVGANYLPRVPRWHGAADVANALGRLAVDAGERRIDSWDPVYDPLKQALREGIAPQRRALFDLFACFGGEDPAEAAVADLIGDLAMAIRADSGAMEPRSFMDGIRIPVRLLHGRSDHLIPYTETLRAAEALEGVTDVRSTITGLFAHSEADLGGGGRVRESVRLFRALAELLGRV